MATETAEAVVPVRPHYCAWYEVLVRLFMGIACFCWGTAQIAPVGAALDLSIGPINLGDLSFVAVCALLTTSQSFRAFVPEFLARCRLFVLLVLAFTGLGIASAFANAFGRDLNPSDVFEVGRPAYYLVVAAVACFFVRSGRMTEVLLLFPLGIVAASINNFALVLTGEIEKVASVVQLYNRNVVGNLLAVAFIFTAIAFRSGLQLWSLLLSGAALLLIVFSFSKGAWVMGALGIGCYAAMYSHASATGSLKRSVRALTALAGVAVLVVGLLNVTTIVNIVELKIKQSFASETERSQSTVAQRVGHVMSSLEITAHHPLLGVGVTNWEAANNENAYWLNDVFLVNDNPHNGFFYILSGMGVPAFVAFFGITLLPVTLLPDRLGLPQRHRRWLRLLMLAILLVSGNFMLHILSHYFLWLLCGLSLGLALRAAPMPHPAVQHGVRTN